MKKLSADVCAVTHAGRVRRENEDNYSLNGRMTTTDLRKGSAYVQHMTEPFHLSVCDGMGGESYGELASGIAVETIAAHASRIYDSGEDFSFAVSNCLDDANTRICRKITEKGKRMGTTLAAIYAVKGSIICVNIGDTRIYHYSKGVLDQISFDHTHAQTIVDAGQVSQDNMSRIPDAKRLTRHLGVFPEESNLSPNISVINDVDNGDIIMLCSDGLTDYLTDDDITGVLSTSDSPQDAAGKLVRMALERGGKDNVTIITAFIQAEETAIFATRAAAMVGDTDADYEEEYRNSYGSNQTEGEETTSPYANADARAYIKPTDKAKVLKIAGIVAAVALVLVAAALVIKTVVKGKNEQETTFPLITEEIRTYTYPSTAPIDIWSELSTEESTSQTEPKTERSTRRHTTTRRANRTTTTRRHTNPATKPTTAPHSTAPVTEATTAAHTEPVTQPVTEPVTKPSEAHVSESQQVTEQPVTPNNPAQNPPEQ